MAEKGYAFLDPLALPWKELRRFPERFPEWHVAKVSSARTVVGLTVDAPGGKERLYFKRGLRRGPFGRLSLRMRASKEWREWQLARAFGRSGVWVPQPLFYAEALDPSAGCEAVFLVTRALEPTWIEAKSFFKTERRFEREWRSLAAFMRRLHELDLYHADFRSDHLFLDRTRVGVWEDISAWALIDLDGSTTGRDVPRASRERALLQLSQSLMSSGLTTEHLADFLTIYDPPGRWKFDAATLHTEAARQHRRG